MPFRTVTKFDSLCDLLWVFPILYQVEPKSSWVAVPMLVRCYDPSALLFYTYPRSSRHYDTIPSASLSFIFIYCLTVSFLGHSVRRLIVTNSVSACRNFLSKSVVSIMFRISCTLSE